MKGYLRKRGDAWQLMVYAGRAGAGQRRYVSESFRGTKRDAERRLAELIGEVSSGRRSAPTGSTVASLADEWWETVAPGLSPTTRRGYRRLLDVRIIPALGSKRITRLSARELDRYYADLAAGRAPGGGPLAPRSIRHIHAVISGMLSTAVRWGWIPSSPAERARLPRIAGRDGGAPEPDVVERLLDTAGKHDPEFAVYLRLAVATGARRSELCALRWTDIDFDTGEFHLARAIASSDTDPQDLVEKDTKTHQARRLAIDAGSIDALRRHREAMEARASALETPYAADAFVFSDEGDGSRPWHPDAVSSTFRRVARRAGVDGVRLHDLRHYHGTMLADLGIPMPSVRDRLGHRDLQTTNIYAHGRRAADRAAADVIGRHLDGVG